MSNFTFNVFIRVLSWSTLYKREKILKWRVLKLLNVFSIKCSLNSLTLKYTVEFSRLDVFSVSFILSIRIPSCVFCFFLIFIKLRFLSVILVRKLVLSSFEKGKTPLDYFMQLQEVFFFQNVIYVCAYFVTFNMNPNITGIAAYCLKVFSNWFFTYFTGKFNWHGCFEDLIFPDYTSTKAKYKYLAIK